MIIAQMILITPIIISLTSQIIEEISQEYKKKHDHKIMTTIIAFALIRLDLLISFLVSLLAFSVTEQVLMT